MLRIQDQIRVARDLLPELQEVADGIYQAPCPGAHLHSTPSKPQDFRIWFEEGKKPHCHCLHNSCAGELDAFMRRLYSAIWASENAGSSRLRQSDLAPQGRPGIAPAPTLRPTPRGYYTPAMAAYIADLCPIPSVDESWLRDHSPVAIPKDPARWPKLLLDSLFNPGDKLLIFTKYQSQGQILHTVGGVLPPEEDGGEPRTVQGSTLRLADRPVWGKVAPELKSTPFPKGAASGVWFLCAPVLGRWLPNNNGRTKEGNLPLGRRHAACCTRFPYLVLESDECPPADWLRILVQLRDPIAAITTSGGKSYHALIRIDAASKEAFDAARAQYALRLAPLGADVAAMSAVRLTRLPGCLRFGSGLHPDYHPYKDEEGNPAPRMQQLLYLNPQAGRTPICSRPQRSTNV